MTFFSTSALWVFSAINRLRWQARMSVEDFFARWFGAPVWSVVEWRDTFQAVYSASVFEGEVVNRSGMSEGWAELRADRLNRERARKQGFRA